MFVFVEYWDNYSRYSTEVNFGLALQSSNIFIDSISKITLSAYKFNVVRKKILVTIKLHYAHDSLTLCSIRKLIDFNRI